MSNVKIIEIYSKGCLSCDYIYRLQNRLDIYHDIIHYEFTSKEAQRFGATTVPTFYIIIDGNIVSKIENPERKDIEKIKRLL